MFLTRDQILGSELPSEEVSTPEWAGKVLVRTLPIGDRLAFEQAVQTHKEKPLPCVLAAFAACDENGTPLFTIDDIDRLCAKDPRPIIRIARAAARLNAVAKDDIDELEKNS